ncbi:bifunctional precorrin-2 dehydrogenase/sirohydrochlorin ferrochelatase [Flavobacteriaceae bacterium]|nr:bifunctional precorrin-2 dehydrogenase/sirohydrochlorin ferrochelatase [Flavobacteriaceae bacterium]MDB4117969.1 bifunctional precorrin-2 dehydrogenase/sirohydrochlorin ferrochelatase [Flavobacteriaceae bacterium]
MRELNELYPIFLKASKLEFLIVGGGYVALEKMEFLFKSSPNAKVTLVAPFFRPETKKFIEGKDVKIIERKFRLWDLRKKNIVIATTDAPAINQKVRKACNRRRILVNVADTPDLCDFYMGGIVTKGNLKIGISTNGKSPTMAKRIRQFLEELLPDEIDDLLTTLREYRTTLKADFEEKVIEMNERTKLLLEDKK